jgi:hypothetical protein
MLTLDTGLCRRTYSHSVYWSVQAYRVLLCTLVCTGRQILTLYTGLCRYLTPSINWSIQADRYLPHSVYTQVCAGRQIHLTHSIQWSLQPARYCLLISATTLVFQASMRPLSRLQNHYAQKKYYKKVKTMREWCVKKRFTSVEGTRWGGGCRETTCQSTSPHDPALWTCMARKWWMIHH